MSLLWTRTEITYAIEVPKRKFLKIIDRDHEEVVRGRTLVNRLLAVDGVRAVEYDAMTGGMVFVRLDVDPVDHDTPETRDAVSKTIEDYAGGKP